MKSKHRVVILAGVLVLGSAGGCIESTVDQTLDEGYLEDVRSVPQAAGTKHAIITCQDATMYANACGPDGPRDVIKVLPYGDKIGLRSDAGCASWAVVLDYGPNKWGFVLRECITTCNGPDNPVHGCF